MKRGLVVIIIVSFSLLVTVVGWWLSAPKSAPAEVNHVNAGMVAGQTVGEEGVKQVAARQPVEETRHSEDRIDVQIPRQIAGQGGGGEGSATLERETKNTPQTRYQAYQAVARAVQRGRRLPVALMDGHQNVRLTAQQRSALESLEQEFLDTLQTAMENADENSVAQNSAMQEQGEIEVPAGVWEKARSRADHRFRLLFGHDAFNRMTVSSAVDATDN